MIWFVMYWSVSGVLTQLGYLIACNIFSKHTDIIPEDCQSEINDLRVYLQAIKSSGNEPFLLLILLTFGFLILPLIVFEVIKETIKETICK